MNKYTFINCQDSHYLVFQHRTLLGIVSKKEDGLWKVSKHNKVVSEPESFKTRSEAVKKAFDLN